jgi:hypothetical protein
VVGDESIQGSLEAPLADVAPRAHQVGPDLDSHAPHNGSRWLAVPVTATGEDVIARTERLLIRE